VEQVPTLLCVHPHPDDESIACGGVLARAADAGHRTVVVTCTGGEEGENLAGIDLGNEDLPTHRRRELAAALAALDVAEHVELGYRDSGMAGTPANDHPASFHRADLDEAALRLATVLRSVRPDVVVSDDEHGSYGHPDHVKAHRVTVRAVALAADPDAPLAEAPWPVPKRYVHTLAKGRLWAMHQGLVAAGVPSPFGDGQLASPDELSMGTDDGSITTVVDVTRWLPAKRAALVAHRSQIGPDSFFLNTPEEVASDVFGTEEFVLEAGRPGAPEGGREDDLFAGLAGRLGAVAGGSPPGATAPPPAATAVAGRFRDVLARFATGVTVMTTVVGGEPHGMTASSVASVSLDPPLVLVCVERSTVMAEEVVAGGVFALSFLAVDQADLSGIFADSSRPSGHAQFTGVATHPAATGAPILDGAVGWIDATVWKIHDGGDHLIVVGEVVALDQTAGRQPLVYHQGGYHRLDAAT
jgi:N-acetyl-1-D-myo-inositol-2-amino-2-deoxy-alpha-D-glucopyranoside deacetylase